MVDIANKIEVLKNNLEEIDRGLGLIDFQNFDNQLFLINEKINSVRNLRTELLKKYNITELKKYNDNLNDKTKQIQFKFDNLIKEYKSLVFDISSKLIQIENKKKLVNYSRWKKMKIDGINNQFQYLRETANNIGKKKDNERNTKDKIEISKEAIEMNNSKELEQTKLTQVSLKIKSNLYNYDKVLDKVASSILNELKSK